MSRARNLKPGFFKNEDLAELPPLGRILFAGLWCEADRRGILEDRPKRLKAELLPYDDCDVDALLGQLYERGFIRRYEADGVRCIFIPNFGKHQNPHVKEQANTLPAPPETGEHQASTGLAPDQHRASPADSLNPLPNHPLPLPDSGDTPLPPKGGKARQIKTAVPDDLLIPPEDWAAMAAEQGMTDAEMQRETAAMKDHYRGKGERRVDWVATWRNWMRSPYRRKAPPFPVAPTNGFHKFTLEEERAFRAANPLLRDGAA